ncbi:MAG: aldo/keto reductase [Firmicutes bacterium]|nr:aldo/keto reductase [Bacillota bacterium]
MIYNKFKDLQLSSLGFGAMRLTGGESGWGGPIHETAEKMVEYAYANGVNYFDTSYFYHGGDSERFLGKALSQFPRESWYLASKLPGNLMSIKNGQIEISGKTYAKPLDVFEFQLERCGVDYFDFFMLHNLAENTYRIYTDENLGIIDCLLEQKAKGRIRHLGFSSHGRHETIDRFLSEMKAKGCNDFEFVLIQLNYMDWTLQEARKKYEVITNHGLSVFVMEPLRGGRLANLGPEADAMLKAVRQNDSHAAWAFRYLQSLDNIPVILSGMSNINQIKENIKIFSKHDPLSPEEAALLDKVLETIVDRVPCTTCGYCTEDCPQNLDIPTLLMMYNEASHAMVWHLEAAIRMLKPEEKPGACTSCGRCKPLCPQNIDIPDALAKFGEIIS